MKVFLANSVLSYISRIFVYSPFIVAIILSINHFNYMALFIVMGLVISYILYNCNLCWYMGFLLFKEKYLFIPNDFVTKITRLQYKEKIFYDEISAIEYKDLDGNSIGKELWRANSVSYIEITTNDNHIHRVAIGKYSHKKWKKIEKEIIKRVPNILILKSSDELIKYRKY